MTQVTVLEEEYKEACDYRDTARLETKEAEVSRGGTVMPVVPEVTVVNVMIVVIVVTVVTVVQVT